MATLASLLVRLGVDDSDLQTGLGRTATAVDKFSGKLSDAGKSMMKMGATATVGMTLPIAAAGKALFDTASDMQETLSKSNTIFGEHGKAIEKWADDAAERFGQTKQGALEAAATFGNLFLQLGIGGEAASKMSTGLTELASDFASFHNADPTEVLEAMTAAFRGEYDAVQRFVPTISAATVEHKALAMGLAKSAKELDSQDKALATNALLMEGAGAAAGDFARTADGAANKQRTLSASFKDAAAELGTNLLPIGEQVIGWVLRLVEGFNGLSPSMQRTILIVGGVLAAVGPLTTVVGGLVAAFGFLLTPVGAVLAIFGLLAAAVAWLYLKNEEFRASVDGIARAVSEAVMPVLRGLADDFQNKILPVLRDAAAFVGEKLVGAFDMIRGALERNRPELTMLFNALKTVAIWVGEHVIPVLGWLAGVLVGSVGASITQTIDSVGWFVRTIVWLADTAKWARDGIVGAFAAVADAIKGAINWILKAWNKLEFKLPKVDLGPLGTFGGMTLGTADIPLLADGGSILRRGLAVVGERGPELLDLNAGAQVRPLPAMSQVAGGGELTVVLDVDGYQLGRRVVPGVRAGLLDVQRANVTSGIR